MHLYVVQMSTNQNQFWQKVGWAPVTYETYVVFLVELHVEENSTNRE